jgi:hypothetical protein
MAAYDKEYGDYVRWEDKFRAASGQNAKDNIMPVWQDQSSALAWTNSLHGSTLPHYRQLIRNGLNATTNMSASMKSLDPGVTYAHVFGNTLANESIAGFRRREALFPLVKSFGTLSAHSVDSEAENAARTVFHKRYERVLTQFQGGVFLGELREALHMIRNPAMSLRKGLSDYLSALKKGRRGSPARRTSFIRKTWLEYSFGWAPFLNDLDNARHYLERRQDYLYRELVRVSGEGGRSALINDTLSSEGDGIFAISWRLKTMRTTEVQYKAAVRSDPSSKRLITQSSLGLSPRSFVPTLWELLPWSFCIDYFTNIGDVLTAWSNQLASPAWVSRVERKFTEVSPYNFQSLNDSSLKHVYDNYAVPAGGKSVTKTVVRSRDSEVPVPMFQYELPGFGTKFINLIALTAARRRLQPF